ncbi:ABC transporter substrate-binding protein [Asticcacaulis sp. 201]|uniref:ABC transporter substrate-binding protein n=1 Tax=Asticcacaulis sp. 201 TaxID=3028787 RepID=UPI002916614A|nr:ABC transporter substrate-binding protein [Asticcacaulis sp. 201]MDV6332189.1 ABC transporter substrate-binding protein [Asticcacaulis sp. 201]
MTKARPTDTAPSPAPLIWYARCPTLTALGLIANRGVLQREFLRENVHLVSVRENSTPSVRQGHLDHTLPNLIREADAATALWAHGQNERSRLLAVGQTWHTISIVTRPGQSIQSLSDLAGRRLSLIKEAGNFSPAQVRSLRAWETVLEVAGVAKTDIEFVPVVADHPSVPFGDVARREVEAVLSGHTDVAILFGAKGLELVRSAHLKTVHRFTPEEIKADARLSGLVELRAVTVDSVLLEGRADIVTRILDNLVEAARWAERFPNEAIRQAAIEGKVELEDAVTAYGSLLTEGAQIGIDSSRLSTLAGLADWLKHRHLLPSAHRLDDWLAPAPLQKVQDGLSAYA